MSSTLQYEILHSLGWQDRFEILEKIGSGAMGQVWRAREISTDLIVALKVLDPSRLGDEQTLARLEIEGETLTKLREAGAHDHIVPILDFKITESHACLVMEFIPGMNLKKWCSMRQSTLEQRVKFIVQVARAAGWFHQLGIVHRDLKPANILVSAITHQPVIVDFSIAKVETELTLTLTNEALGTAPYMAPEQIDRRRAPVSPATDVYALGATLYELLTQVHPHPGELTAIIQRHMEEVRPAAPSVLNPAIPRDLEFILLKALSHRPTDRYTDGTQLAEDLDRFLEGLPVRARPISRLTYLIRQARRKPVTTAATAASLMLSLLAVWTMRKQAFERESLQVETQLSIAMQGPSWTTQKLTEADSLLTLLKRHSTDRASELARLLVSDAAKDVEAALQRSHLQASELEWMQDTVEWLGKAAPATGAPLYAKMQERRSRWENLASLSAPFTNLGEFFPHSKVLTEGALLRSRTQQPMPKIVVREGLPLPLEFTGRFSVDKTSVFKGVGMGFSFARVSTEALVCRAADAPKEVLAALPCPPDTPDQLILALLQRGSVLAAQSLSGDSRMKRQSFLFQIRIQPRRIDIVLADRWKLSRDMDFFLGSTEAANECYLLWPDGVAVQELTLKTQSLDVSSPLEKADLLALRTKWVEALHLYEALRGDPSHGTEANYKAAHCLRQLNDVPAAMHVWHQLSLGLPSEWRDRAAYQLWTHTALSRGVTAANPLMADVPNSPPRAVLREFDRDSDAELERIYYRQGLGIGFPGAGAERVVHAARAFRLLDFPLIEIANRFGMIHHIAHLEESAFHLHLSALEKLDSVKPGTQSFLAATNCLDQICRLAPQDAKGDYARLLDLWKTEFAADPTIICIYQTDLGRRAARSGDLADALDHIRLARQPTGADSRRLVSNWLLEGMLHHQQGDSAQAQEAWLQGLQTAKNISMRSPLHLCDCILLHCLTRTWDTESSTQVIGKLLTQHLGNERQERNITLGRYQALLLNDTAFLSALNHVMDSPSGLALARDYALCLDHPRSLIQRFYHLLFEEWFLRTAFAQPTQEQTARVQLTVSQLISEMIARPDEDSANFHAFLRAWNVPAAANRLFEQSYPYNAALIENLRWLLKERHSPLSKRPSS